MPGVIICKKKTKIFLIEKLTFICLATEQMVKIFQFSPISEISLEVYWTALKL